MQDWVQPQYITPIGGNKCEMCMPYKYSKYLSYSGNFRWRNFRELEDFVKKFQSIQSAWLWSLT